MLNPVLVLLISQAIQLIVSAVLKNKVNGLDVAPALMSLNDALGHATEESDAERATRQQAAEAIFAKHSVPLTGA
jgi:hypothetical protein